MTPYPLEAGQAACGELGRAGRVVLVRHPPDLAEAVAYFLFEAGACAVLQEEAPSGTDLALSRAGFGPEGPRPGVAEELKAFLADLARIFGLARVPRAEWHSVPPGDWAEKWKEDWAPIEIGPTLVVKPSWCDYDPRPGQVVLKLDPGRAFGTGRHASTYLCLEALEEYFRGPAAPEARVLDVGTGSGILGLACAALGQGLVVAIDNDPWVMPVAARNAAANPLAGRFCLACAEPAALAGRFDLILANLTANKLRRLAPDLARLAAPGARLVLSGLLRNQTSVVARSHARQGLAECGRKEMGEWAAVIMVRPEA